MSSTNLLPSSQQVGGGYAPAGQTQWGVVVGNNNASIAALQTPAATTRTYITGSALSLPDGAQLKVGTKAVWKFNMTKTAAGTATSTIDIAFATATTIAAGTAGTTADTATLSFTKPVGTAAIDEGTVTIEMLVTKISATAGGANAECVITHNTAATGHMTIPVANLNATVTNADTTQLGQNQASEEGTAYSGPGMTIGLCITTGASDVITIGNVTAQLSGL